MMRNTLPPLASNDLLGRTPMIITPRVIANRKNVDGDNEQKQKHESTHYRDENYVTIGGCTCAGGIFVVNDTRQVFEIENRRPIQNNHIGKKPNQYLLHGKCAPRRNGNCAAQLSIMRNHSV